MKEVIEQTIKIFGVSLTRYFVIAGVPFLIFYILFASKYATAKIQKKLANKKDFGREILHSILATLVFAVIAAVLLFSPIRQYTLFYQDINSYPLWWIPVSVFISLVIHDTYFYWMHRILHHKKIFKYAHLLHHRSVNPSPWTSYSFHLAESIAEGGILVVLAFVLPMHFVAVILFIVIGFIINVYGHLGYEIMPRGLRKSFMFEIVNTSVHHNLHHSKFKGNYGLYFRIWDRICKTEHPDYVKEYDRIQQQRFGKSPVSNRKRVTVIEA